MRRAVLLAPALLLVAACGGEADTAADSGTSSSASDPSSSEAGASSAPAPADDDVDVTAQLQEAAAGAAWASTVTSALQTEPGRLVITTSITDPRGDDGSPEAQQATEVCEGGVTFLQSQGAPAINVRVNEADGTAFIIYGAPAGDACTEY